MKCRHVRRSLVFYLDREVTPDERRQMQQHLAACSTCQREMAALTAARYTASQALQSLAAQAEPSPQAWSRLQARLAEEARPSPSRLSVWLSRLAPGVSRTAIKPSEGGKMMYRRFWAPALAATLALVVFAVFAVNNAAPVSAQQILDRAEQAQAAAGQAQGIWHIRSESYQDLRALGQGTRTFSESYLDLQTHDFRRVTTNESGRVLEVFANDGQYTYSYYEQAAEDNTPVTVYRSPQGRVDLPYETVGDPFANAKQMFETAKENPNVTLLGKETGPDGRAVYVLRMVGPAKVLVDDQGQMPTGTTTMTFDAETYRLVENRTTIEKDGQEVLVSSFRYLVWEVLPAGSAVAWDLSDLQGVAIADDPSGEHTDLLPEVISRDELAARAPAAFVLGTLPKGVKEEITAPPKQDEGRFVYVASYRNQAGDYIVLQSLGAAKELGDQSAGTYRTAAGFVLTFVRDAQAPEGKRVVSAVLTAPDGSAYSLSSTLPREQVEALAEDLAPAQR